jgi:hypothetical protein
MKRLLFVLAALILLVAPASTEPWGGKAVTVSAGTAVRLVPNRTIATSLFFQMKTGGSGKGYILYAPTSVTCALNGTGTTFIAELQPATSTAPGGNAVIPSNPDPYGGVDVSLYCVDGSNSGDVITTSWNTRN